MDQPIDIELIPAKTKDAAVILVRSDAPITMHALVSTLENFIGLLKEKLSSKIERIPEKRIITP